MVEMMCGYPVDDTRKKVWAVELDIFKKFIELCERNGLTYYTFSGTLIGAVRHKGFVPWDDDIDIVMFRKDYDRFVEIAATELEEPYFLQTTMTDNCYRPHAQIRNSNTTGYLKKDENLDCNKGIFIDIFPLDAVTDNPSAFRVQTFKMKLINRILVNYYYFDAEHEKPEFYKKVFHSLVKTCLKKDNGRWLYKKYEQCCTEFENRRTECVGQISILFDNERFKWSRELFDETIELPFEDIMVKCPAGYDKILRHTYGNYMMYPDNKEEKTLHGDMVFEPDVPYKDLKK